MKKILTILMTCIAMTLSGQIMLDSNETTNYYNDRIVKLEKSIEQVKSSVYVSKAEIFSTIFFVLFCGALVGAAIMLWTTSWFANPFEGNNMPPDVPSKLEKAYNNRLIFDPDDVGFYTQRNGHLLYWANQTHYHQHNGKYFIPKDEMILVDSVYIEKQLLSDLLEKRIEYPDKGFFEHDFNHLLKEYKNVD